MQVGTLTDRITLGLAKPVVTNYAKERINRFNLSATRALVLKTVVLKDLIQVKEIADALGNGPATP